jgi:hypothetical protein
MLYTQDHLCMIPFMYFIKSLTIKRSSTDWHTSVKTNFIFWHNPENSLIYQGTKFKNLFWLNVVPKITDKLHIIFLFKFHSILLFSSFTIEGKGHLLCQKYTAYLHIYMTEDWITIKETIWNLKYFRPLCAENVNYKNVSVNIKKSSEVYIFNIFYRENQLK